MAEYVTYVILDPRDNSPFYIGQTNDFERRRQQHLSAGDSPRPKLGTINIRTYLHDLLSAGIVPEIKILERCETLEASLSSETKWINYCVEERGFPLVNRKKEHRAIIKSRFTSAYLKKHFVVSPEEKIF